MTAELDHWDETGARACPKQFRFGQAFTALEPLAVGKEVMAIIHSPKPAGHHRSLGLRMPPEPAETLARAIAYRLIRD